MDLFLRASIALLGFLTPLVSTAAPSDPPVDTVDSVEAEPAPGEPTEASQSDTTQPDGAQPSPTEPAVTEPQEGGVAVTQPGGDQPAETVPSTNDPATTVPPTTGPDPVDGGGEPVPCQTPSETAQSTTVGDQAIETTIDPPSDQTTVPAETNTAPACDPTSTTGPDGGTTTIPADPTGAELETTTSTPADPLHDEAPPEDVPDTDETVPALGGTYGGQTSFKPAEVLWSSVKAAEAKVAQSLRTQEERIEAVRQIRRKHKELRVAQRALGDEARLAAAEISDAQTLLTERAVAAFVNDDALSNAVIGSFDAADHDRILDLRVRRRLLDAVLQQDEDAIQDYLTLRSQIDDDVLGGLDTLRVVERALRQSTSEAEAAAEDVVQAENELEAFAAGSAIYIDDVVFPVGDGYSVPLIDSYGFPRMPGTPDEHWHEGIDIFAPSGTPLVATERGIVTRVGSGRLGGLTVWVRGESGTDWYYAHLLSHAPGLVEGMVVDGGDLLGYVGNTGNARTTPPHLHMQVHPGGGDPVNPYPLLKVISDRDQSRIDN